MASVLLKSDPKLMAVLKKAANILKLNSPSVTVDTAAVGEGIMGDIYRASLQTGKENPVKLVVKQAPKDQLHRAQALSELAYKNEIHFYSNAVPQLRKFEQEHKVAESGIRIPEFITSDNSLGGELIVIRDLNNEGYVLKDKHEVVDEKHFRLIFENYGRFHATSFCMKTKKPEQFQRLVQPFQNMWTKNLASEDFVEGYRQLVENTVQVLNPVIYSHIHEKLLPYYASAEGLKQIFLDSVTHEGEYGCLLHGDCWSNNMMFKYNKSTGMVEALKLLDFQLAGFGSPIHDLSYFLHIGASQLHFGNWETLLDIYYASFADTVKRYNENAEKLLPKEKLAEDWKKYSKSSMLLSMLLLKMKFLSKADTLKLIEKFKATPSTTRNVGFSDINYDVPLFTTKMQNIFQHMYAIDGL